MNRPTSFRLHVRRMFRQEDVEQMKLVSGLDLSKRDEVKEWAARIIDRLESTEPQKVMPPLPPKGSGPWPAEWLQLFKRWVAEDYPE